MHLRPSPHMHVSFLPVHTGEERGFWQTTKRGEGSLLSSPLLFPPRLWLQYPARRPPVRPRLPSGQFAWLPPSWERKGNKGGGRRLNTDSPAPMQRRPDVSLLPSPPPPFPPCTVFFFPLRDFFGHGAPAETTEQKVAFARKWFFSLPEQFNTACQRRTYFAPSFPFFGLPLPSFLGLFRPFFLRMEEENGVRVRERSDI